jgi:transcription-repair coupling factor (superfamily II helicase)
VDLFLPLSNHPIRIDFFGDEIEDLSYFEVADQRTFAAVIGSVEIYPCREMLVTPEIKHRAIDVKEEYPAAAEMLEKISEGIAFEGMESLIPLLIDETETLLSRMPANTQIVFIDEQRIRSRAADLLATNEEFLNASWSNAALGGIAPLHDGAGTYISWDELSNEIISCGVTRAELSPFGTDLEDGTLFLDYSPIDPMRGDIERTVEVLRQSLEEHRTVVFATHGHGMLERYEGIFRSADLPVQIVENLIATPTKGSIHYGLICRNAETDCITGSITSDSLDIIAVAIYWIQANSCSCQFFHITFFQQSYHSG